MGHGTANVHRALAIGLVVLGSAARLWLGLACRPWLAQPDQLAWAVMLDEAARAGVRLDQLLHAPHDGGTILHSALALALALAGASPLPPLSVAALLADTAARGAQTAAAWAVFGHRTALAFAAWSVLAVPMMLPWGTVNVALHASGSAWPFVLLWALARPAGRTRGLASGAAVALAALWSYSGLVLLLPLALVLAADLRSPSGRRAAAWSAAPLAAGAAALAALRWASRGAYRLEEQPLWSVRSAEIAGEALTDRLPQLWRVWRALLPDALGAAACGSEPAGWLGASWLLLAAAGWLLALRASAPARGATAIAALCVAAYSSVYALSPFSDLPASHGTYFAYRHLAWLVPLLACVALHGWLIRWWSAAAVLAGSVVAPALLLWGSPVAPAAQSSTENIGWIIGRKLGHAPARLDAIAAAAPAPERDAMLRGFGWGMASALHRFGQVTTPDRLPQLHTLIDEFLPLHRPLVSAGVRRALGPGNLPPLDPALAAAWEASGWLGAARLDGALVARNPDHIALYSNGAVHFRARSDGDLVVVAAGSRAAGRGPRVSLLVAGEPVTAATLGEAPAALRVPGLSTGDTVTLRYRDDLVDAAGNDRNVQVLWVGPAR